MKVLELAQIARSSEVVFACFEFGRSRQLSMEKSLDFAVTELTKQYQQLKSALIEKGYDWSKAESELPISTTGKFDVDYLARCSLDSETKIKVLWCAVSALLTISLD